MAKFKGYGLRLHTEYDTEGTWAYHVDHNNARPCFHETFDYLDSAEENESPINIRYHIRLYKGYELMECQSTMWNNACPYDKKFILNHLRQLKVLFPVSISVTEYFNRYVVNMRIKNAPATFHKYALCWVRYLYEFPYNMITMDVYRLLKEPEFSGINIHSLYAFPFASIPKKMQHPHGQQIMRDGWSHTLPIERIKERIESLTHEDECPVNSIFPFIMSKDDDYMMPFDMALLESDTWESEELFKTNRLPIYISLIDKLTK